MLCVSNYFVTCKGVAPENVVNVQTETQVINISFLFYGNISCSLFVLTLRLPVRKRLRFIKGIT